jgi:hypothetical protein
VGTISRERLATRPFAAGPNVPTPGAQMQGATAFAVGLRPNARRDDLLADWERFALPVIAAPATGGGSLARSGSLLAIEGDAVLSNVRRTEAGLEVRLWNPWSDRPAVARVPGRDVRLPPARIETIVLGTRTGRSD